MKLKNIPWSLIIVLSVFGLYPIAAILVFLKLFVLEEDKETKSNKENEKRRKVNPYESDIKISLKDSADKILEDIKEINIKKIEMKDGKYKSVSEDNLTDNHNSQNSRSKTMSTLSSNKFKTVKKPTLNKLLLILAVALFVLASVSSVTCLGDFLRGNFLISEFTKGLTLFLSGVASLACSTFITNRYNNALKYTAVIGDNASYDISELASIMMISEKKVKKQLQKLINDGVFGSGAYIDYRKNKFYSNSSYSKTTDEAEKMANKESIDEYDSILRKIRELNDDIEDKVMSDKIDEIEAVTRNIFSKVREEPEKISEIHTFMTYYLPTTLKLLETYSKLEETGIVGKNMNEAKLNIEKTMDMLASGFNMQLDNLYKDESLDISSDIEVLEKMMYKDGLTDKSPYDIFSDKGRTGQGGV